MMSPTEPERTHLSPPLYTPIPRTRARAGKASPEFWKDDNNPVIELMNLGKRYATPEMRVTDANDVLGLQNSVIASRIILTNPSHKLIASQNNFFHLQSPQVVTGLEPHWFRASLSRSASERNHSGQSLL